MSDQETSGIELRVAETEPTGEQNVTRGTPGEAPAPTENEGEKPGKEAPAEAPAPEEEEPAPEGEKTLAELPLPGEEPEPEGEKKKLPKWVEKKISRKDDEIRAKEAELLQYRSQLEQLNAMVPERVHENLANDPQTPKKEAYASEAEYIAAMIAHTNKRSAELAQQQANRRAMEEGERRFQEGLKAKIRDGKEKYDDYDAKVKPLFSDGFPPNRAMAEAINDSDHGSDILYFLGTYPAEAEKIARLNPIQAVKKIAEIEARFNARKKPEISKAPAPITSIQSNQSKGGSIDNLLELNKNAGNMTQAEFEASFKKLAEKSQVAW